MSSVCVLTPTLTVTTTMSSPITTSGPARPAATELGMDKPADKHLAIHPALRPSSIINSNISNSCSSSSSLIQQKNDLDSYYPSSNEILHESITLLSGANGPKRVILSVFRTTVDHFALVYPDNRRKAVALKPVGCINLRGVTCEETVLGAGLKGFTLRPKKCDTSSASLTFVCSEQNMLPKWLSALSPLNCNINTTNTKEIMSPLTCGSFSTNKRCSLTLTSRQCALPSLEEEEE